MKLSKVLKTLDPEDVAAMNNMSEDELKAQIAASTKAIDTATRERDAMEGYQKARTDIKFCSESLKEVKKHQGAKIAYCLFLERSRSGDEAAEDSQ